jgi:hypothetical protein
VKNKHIPTAELSETTTMPTTLYDLVFLTFATLMIWVRREREALEVRIADRTAKLTAIARRGNPR